MRTILLGVLTAGVLVAAEMPAHAYDYPYCIKGRDYDQAIGDCSFTSMAQCQATASGRPDYCARNPFYANAYAPRRGHRGRLERLDIQSGY